jgi:acetamidase/formamidase
VSRVRRSLLKDTVSVETYAGEGAYGPVYSTAVTVPCDVQMKRSLARSANGDEYVSLPVLTVHPDDVAAFTPETRLTVQGRASTVTSVAEMTFRGTTSHAEVYCS